MKQLKTNYVAPDEFEDTYDARNRDLALTPTQLFPAEASALEQHEASALKQHEAVIERGRTTFIEVGEALQHIRDERLYRGTHDNFDSYCRERWTMSRFYAHRVIAAAQVAENVLPRGNNPTPVTEKQLRPLASLSPENQRVVWEQAVEESNGKPPTALKVSEVKKTMTDRIVERRREAEIVEMPVAGIVEMPGGPQSEDDDFLPHLLSAKELEVLREWRSNNRRNSVVWAFISAIGLFSELPLRLDEVSKAILAMNGPDVDWVGQSKEALRNFQILVKELHR